MLDVLLTQGWREVPPRRGGVRRELRYEDRPGRLVLEARPTPASPTNLWVWIEDDGGERRVLGLDPGPRLGEVLQALVSMQKTLAVDTYIELQQDLGRLCPVTHIAVEQLERLYENVLTEPGDAIYKYFSDVLRAPQTRPHWNATLPDPDPPSAVTGLRLGLASVSSPPRVDYKIGRTQLPNPHEPKARVDYVLWRHDGATWHPVGPPPDPGVVRELEPIARLGFSVDEWAALLVPLAGRLGPAWPHLLGVVAHGSPPPAGFDAFDWLIRMQIAATLTLAALDRGWDPRSPRKRALYNVALGPSDWSVTASCIALAHIAGAEPAAAGDVLNLFSYLRQQSGRIGYTTYAAPLSMIWLRVAERARAGVDLDGIRDWGREAWYGGPSQEVGDALLARGRERQRAMVAQVDFASPEASNVMGMDPRMLAQAS